MMEYIIRFLGETFSTYIITCVITSSSLFEPIRNYIKIKFPYLQINTHPHFIECRLCFTAYAAVLVCFLFQDWNSIFPVYGLAYFMATQER